MNDVRFRGLCPACNHRIGKSEQVLLHCGPEAYFRRVVKPAVPTSRQRGRSPVKAAMGAPSPIQMIDLGDHRMRGRQSDDNPQVVFRVDQLVVHDSQGKEHFFRLFPGMRADALKAKIEKEIAPLPIPRMWLHCDERYREEYEKLVRAMWSQGERHGLPPTPVGLHPADGKVKMTVNQHYWQSLAKIGFHYYLSRSRRGVRGNERGFAAMRDFIMNGGDKDQFFRKPSNPFVMPFGELADGRIRTPTQWCHVLAANETTREVVAYVQLFVGPQRVPAAHHIALGTLESDVIGLESFVRGHVYLYDEKQNPAGRAGRVEEATMSLLPKSS